MKFITLTKGDPEFEPHLLGTFSRTLRALPVETYHPATSRERVTFQLIPLSELRPPAWWRVYFKSARPELLPLTLGPAVAAWLNQPQHLSDWTKWPSWFALLGVLFLHVAVFLITDVQDHVRGFDRQNHRRGSQVIQRGWVTAAAMKKWALLNLALAVLFGVPAFLNAPLELSIICLAAFVCLVILVTKFAVRFGLADVALLALFGPLLTCGIGLASFGQASAKDFVLGLAFGASALWAFQARQLEYLFRSQARGFRTFLGFLDFERAKVLCSALGLSLLVIEPAAAIFLKIPIAVMALMPFASGPVIWAAGRILRAASPLSSNLIYCDRLALGSHLAWTVWWIFALGLLWL